MFFSADPDTDLNGDGVVNTIDLGIFRSLFFNDKMQSLNKGIGFPCACARFKTIEPRFNEEVSLQRRLLVRGSALEREARVFAQICALQSMLTSRETAQRLPAAACRMPGTARQIADKV